MVKEQPIMQVATDMKEIGKTTKNMEKENNILFVVPNLRVNGKMAKEKVKE